MRLLVPPAEAVTCGPLATLPESDPSPGSIKNDLAEAQAAVDGDSNAVPPRLNSAPFANSRRFIAVSPFTYETLFLPIAPAGRIGFGSDCSTLSRATVVEPAPLKVAFGIREVEVWRGGLGAT
jgi:hypothetical protein